MSQEKNSKLTVFTLVLVLLNLALTLIILYPRLTASRSGEPRNANTGASMERPGDQDIAIERYLKNELHFSDDQIRTFKQLQAQHLPKANALRQQTYRLRNEIMALLFNDNPNKSRIEELSYELGLTHEKLEKEIFFYFLKLMAQCRPEQKENLKKLLRKVFEKYRPAGYSGETMETKAGSEPLPPEIHEIKNKPRPDQPQRGQIPPEIKNEPRPNQPQRGQREGEDRVAKDVETLTSQLSLTPAQVKQAQVILTRFHEKENETGNPGEQGRPGRDGSKELKDERDRQIESILTPKQLETFRKFREETRPDRR
ncbi:MAG: Spy/CpxP family protein refolding chaperone [Candidatus Omnitrophota bacterium]